MKLDCRKWIKMLLYIRLLLTFCIVNSYSVVSLTGSSTQWFFRFGWTLQYCSELGQHLHLSLRMKSWYWYEINLCTKGPNSLHICQIIEVLKCPMLLACQCPYPLTLHVFPQALWSTFSLIETDEAPECQFEHVWGDICRFCTLVRDVLTVTMSAVKREEGEAKATRSSLHHLQGHRENRLPKLFRLRSIFYQISMLSLLESLSRSLLRIFYSIS